MFDIMQSVLSQGIVPWLSRCTHRSHSRGRLHLVVLSVAIAHVLLAPCQHSFADEQEAPTASPDTPKLYSPFDEPKPRIPAEISSDRRLDTKVTISVRCMNMKQLFADLSAKTGVKVTANRQLWGERPVVFLHDKPLRDVMIEISALYGYHWFVTGHKDAWSYELSEDLVHSKRRDQVRDSQEEAKAKALLDAIEEASAALRSDAALARLQQTNPRLYGSVVDPGKRELLKLIMLMDRATIRALLNDVGMIEKYSDLSPQMQSAVLKTLNAGLQNGNDPKSEPWTADQLKTSVIQIKRWRATIFTPPHVCLYVNLPGKDGGPGKRYMSGWPSYDVGEPDLLNMPAAPAGRVIGDQLPHQTKITIKQIREQLYGGSILVGDVLEAIAKQAGVNIVADYYFQETSLPACTDQPLDVLVSNVCRQMDYTCQVEKDTLRFRSNKWFLQPLPDEPPSSLQEHWWRKVIETGGLSLNDLLDIACLPGQETFWGGFRFIPQAWQARYFPRTARVVRMLGSILEAEACTPEGLPVCKLSDDQFSRITDWATVMGVKSVQDELPRCTIKIEKSGDPINSLKFTLVLPDGTPRTVPLSATLQHLDEKQRHKLAEEKASEQASDTIELSVSGKE